MPDYSYEVGEHLSIALYAAPSLKTWELMGSEFLFSKFRAANFCRITYHIKMLFKTGAANSENIKEKA